MLLVCQQTMPSVSKRFSFWSANPDCSFSASPATPSTISKLPSNAINLLFDSLLSSDSSTSLDSILSIAKHYNISPSNFYGRLNPCHRTRTLQSICARLSPARTSIESPSVRSQNAILKMFARGWGREELEKVVFGVALPIWEAVRLCQLDAPENWPEGAYKIIRRDDLARQVGGKLLSDSDKRAVSQIVSIEWAGD